MRTAVPGLALALALGLASSCDPGPDPTAGGDLTVLNAVDGRPFFDFGRLPYGARAEHVFLFRNDAAKPVTVRDLLPSCGCATPSLAYVAEDGTRVQGTTGGDGPVITLPPGAVAELLVRVETEHVQVMNIDKLATVRMRSDSPGTPFLTFEVHLVVERTMRAVPASVDLGQTPRGAGKSGRTDVTCDLPDAKARVKGLERVEGPFTATVDETEISGVTVWIVVVTADKDLELGPARGKVVLATTKEDGTGEGAPFEIPVSAQISEDVVLRPPVLEFGSIAKGTAKRVEAELAALVPGERVRVTKAELEAESEAVKRWIAVEATPIEPVDDGSASRWTVVLQSWPSLEEPLFSGTLVIETDHPRVPEIRAPFSGAVR